MFTAVHNRRPACCPEIVLARMDLQEARAAERDASKVLRQLQVAGAPPLDLRYAAEKVDREAERCRKLKDLLQRVFTACGVLRSGDGRATGASRA